MKWISDAPYLTRYANTDPYFMIMFILVNLARFCNDWYCRYHSAFSDKIESTIRWKWKKNKNSGKCKRAMEIDMLTAAVARQHLEWDIVSNSIFYYFILIIHILASSSVFHCFLFALLYPVCFSLFTVWPKAKWHFGKYGLTRRTDSIDNNTYIIFLPIFSIDVRTHTGFDEIKMVDIVFPNVLIHFSFQFSYIDM